MILHTVAIIFPYSNGMIHSIHLYDLIICSQSKLVFARIVDFEHERGFDFKSDWDVPPQKKILEEKGHSDQEIS